MIKVNGKLLFTLRLAFRFPLTLSQVNFQVSIHIAVDMYFKVNVEVEV